MGCQLQKGKKGELCLKLKEAGTRYKSQENRVKFRMEMERIEDKLRPNEPEHKREVKLDFVTVKMNPFQDRYQTSIALLPRVVVAPHQSDHPCYLEVAKTLHKSEYYIYRHIRTNYNMCEVKEVRAKELYAMFLIKQKEKWKNAETHRGSQCIESEKSCL